VAQAAPSQELLRLCGLPSGAPAAAVRAALNKPDGHGNLPIHNAVCMDPATGPELIFAMLEAGGDAMLGVPGSFKRLPLHHAAIHSRSPAVVALLLARGPAASARDSACGGTALAYAEVCNTGPAAAEIKALLRAAM
jgi:ankyrin repeat protein